MLCGSGGSPTHGRHGMEGDDRHAGVATSAGDSASCPKATTSGIIQKLSLYVFPKKVCFRSRS